jgi:hypothetical protein
MISRTGLECDNALQSVSNKLEHFEAQVQDINIMKHNNKKNIKKLKMIQHDISDETKNGKIQFVLDNLNVKFSFQERSNTDNFRYRRRMLNRRTDKLLCKIETMINKLQDKLSTEPSISPTMTHRGNSNGSMKCDDVLRNVSSEISRLRERGNDIYNNKSVDAFLRMKNLQLVVYQLSNNTKTGKVQYILDSLNVNHSLEERNQVQNLRYKRRMLYRKLDLLLTELEEKINHLHNIERRSSSANETPILIYTLLFPVAVAWWFYFRREYEQYHH